MYCSEGSVPSQPVCHLPSWLAHLISLPRASRPVGAAVATVAAARKKILENCIFACGLIEVEIFVGGVVVVVVVGVD
jgi:hypothetical protein